MLGAIGEQIVKYNGVYEIYEKNGKPVKRMFYQSEHPFAWSAGLYLWVAKLTDTVSVCAYDPVKGVKT